jgi:hypothetical protein
MIQEALSESHEIPADIRVFPKGFYANNTNVRQDSDVDVGGE